MQKPDVYRNQKDLRHILKGKSQVLTDMQLVGKEWQEGVFLYYS